MAYSRQYYLEHREQILVRVEAYRRTHKEQIKEYKKEYDKRYYQEHLEQKRVYERQHRPRHKEQQQQAKVEVLTYYGNGKLACVKCGFSDILALSIDHINGGGNAHRQALGRFGGSQFYYWLRQNGYPQGYQTLCMNCQWVKRGINNENPYQGNKAIPD